MIKESGEHIVIKIITIPLHFQEPAPAPQSTRAAQAHLAEAHQAGHLVEVLVPAGGLDGEAPGHRVQPQPQQQPHQRQLVLLSARLTPGYGYTGRYNMLLQLILPSILQTHAHYGNTVYLPV